MRKMMVIGSLLALGVAGTALAAEEGFSYSNVELGYIDTELDDFDVSGDGFGLRGSWAFTPNVHGFASYSDLDFDHDVSAETLRIGAGLNWPLSPRLDVIGRLSYVRAEMDVSFGPFSASVDDSGFGLEAGVRGRPMEQLEVTGSLDYVDIGDADDTSLGVGARYYFTSQFAAGGDLSFNDDGTTIMLGLRFDFGR